MFFGEFLLQRVKAAPAGSGHSPGAGRAARCIHGAFSLGWWGDVAGSQGVPGSGSPGWLLGAHRFHPAAAPSLCFPPPAAPGLSSASSSGHPASSGD